MVDEEPKSRGAKIRHLRRSLGESQESFGARFGVKRLAVAHWESGTLPKTRHLAQLVRLFEEAVPGQARIGGLSRQLELPFDEPINLEVKISAKHAYTIHCQLTLLDKAAS